MSERTQARPFSPREDYLNMVDGVISGESLKAAPKSAPEMVFGTGNPGSPSPRHTPEVEEPKMARRSPSSVSAGGRVLRKTVSSVSLMFEASLAPTMNFDDEPRSIVSGRSGTTTQQWRAFTGDGLKFNSEAADATDLNSTALAHGERFSSGNLSYWDRKRRLVKRLLHSKLFDIMIGLVITANAATIGFELSWELEGRDTSSLELLEEIFLITYLVELFARVFSEGFGCIKDHWVKFDLFLVLVGVFNIWIFDLIEAETSQFGFLMVLRMLRLARLARTVRLLVKFKVLWMLVRGLLSSAGTMFYVFVLLSIILYIFSAVAVELITNNSLATEDEEFRQVVEENFKTLPGTMLTLVQFLCLDSIGTIYRPLIQKDFTLFFYFACVILVVPIVLMNLVTAIIVNSAMEQANSDREVADMYEKAEKEKMIKELRRVFQNLDTDNSGQVSEEEISRIGEKDRHTLQAATQLSEPMDVFNALNVDDQHQLKIDEFCNGIWKLATSKASIEVQRMEKQVSVMFTRIKNIEASIESEKERTRYSVRKLDLLANGQAMMQKTLISIQAQLHRMQMPQSSTGNGMPSRPASPHGTGANPGFPGLSSSFGPRGSQSREEIRKTWNVGDCGFFGASDGAGTGEVERRSHSLGSAAIPLCEDRPLLKTCRAASAPLGLWSSSRSGSGCDSGELGAQNLRSGAPSRLSEPGQPMAPWGTAPAAVFFTDECHSPPGPPRSHATPIAMEVDGGQMSHFNDSFDGRSPTSSVDSLFRYLPENLNGSTEREPPPSSESWEAVVHSGNVSPTNREKGLGTLPNFAPPPSPRPVQTFNAGAIQQNNGASTLAGVLLGPRSKSQSRLHSQVSLLEQVPEIPFEQADSEEHSLPVSERPKFLD